MSRCVSVSLPCITFAALVFATTCAHPASAREVAFDADCRPALTQLEQRLLDKAAEGTGSLRRFLFARRAIYDLAIYDTAVWAERVEFQRTRCLRARALARGVETVRLPAGATSPR